MSFNVYGGEWLWDLSDTALPPAPISPGGIIAPLRCPVGGGLLCASQNGGDPTTPAVLYAPAMGEFPCPYNDGEELARREFSGHITALGKPGMEASSADGEIIAFGSVRTINNHRSRATVSLSFDGFGETPRIMNAFTAVYVRRHYRSGVFAGHWAWYPIVPSQTLTGSGVTSVSVGLWYRCVLWFAIQAQGERVDGAYVDGTAKLSVSYT